MAQANVTNISEWIRKPATIEAGDSKAMFASAFQGMESDLTDLLNMAHLETTAINNLIDGFETDEDGEKYAVISEQAAATIQYASFELLAMIQRMSTTYHNVFRIVHGEPIKS